jgi:hypothetical protein
MNKNTIKFFTALLCVYPFSLYAAETVISSESSSQGSSHTEFSSTTTKSDFSASIPIGEPGKAPIGKLWMNAEKSKHEQNGVKVSESNKVTTGIEGRIPGAIATLTGLSGGGIVGHGVVQQPGPAEPAPASGGGSVGDGMVQPGPAVPPYPEHPEIIPPQDPGYYHHHQSRHHHRQHPSYGYRPKWISASNGYVPPGAVVGGIEGHNTLYVCQASYNNSVHPGKTLGTNCNIPYGGSEIAIPSYRILVGHGLHWERIPYEEIAYRGVVGGHESNGTPLYVCRTNHMGTYHPGKTYDGKCDIGYGGYEIGQTDYEVLVKY